MVYRQTDYLSIAFSTYGSCQLKNGTVGVSGDTIRLYQKAKDRRSRQYKGIIKFVERQEDLRKAIGSSSKLIRKYRKEKLDQKSNKYKDAASQLEWNTKVFDQRTKLTEYICEEPVFNTQRLGYQSREILSFIK